MSGAGTQSCTTKDLAGGASTPLHPWAPRQHFAEEVDSWWRGAPCEKNKTWWPKTTWTPHWCDCSFNWGTADAEHSRGIGKTWLGYFGHICPNSLLLYMLFKQSHCHWLMVTAAGHNSWKCVVCFHRSHFHWRINERKKLKRTKKKKNIRKNCPKYLGCFQHCVATRLQS